MCSQCPSPHTQRPGVDEHSEVVPADAAMLPRCVVANDFVDLPLDEEPVDATLEWKMSHISNARRCRRIKGAMDRKTRAM